MLQRTSGVVSLVCFLLLCAVPRQGSAVVDPNDVVAAWLFDEGSGIVAGDYSGNGNDGVLVDSPGFSNDNLPTWETGKFGMALGCDGVDDFMQASAAGLPVGNDDRTIALWVNTPTPTQGNKLLAGWGNGDTGNDSQASCLILGLNGLPSQKPAFWGRQPDLACTLATAVNPECAALQSATWYHLAVTLETDDQTLITTAILYIDGEPEAIKDFATPLTTPAGTHFYVGQFPWVMGAFEGTLDEICVLKGALPQEDIQSLMQGLATVLPPPVPSVNIDPGSIVASYQFEEASGDALDSSGNNNHGALLGGASPPTRVTGRFGMGLAFDGLDDDMLATTTGFPTGTADRTIALWVKTSDPTQFNPELKVPGPQGNRMLAGWGNEQVNQEVSSLVFGLNGIASQKPAFWGRGDRMDLECAAPPETACTQVAADTWYQVTVTTKGKIATLYVDGDLEAKSALLSDLATPAGTTFHLANFPNIMGPFDGTFDEVVVFNVALNQSQIGRLQEGLDSALVPTGACALAGNACELLTSAECTTQSGSYSGDGTTCPTGACQLPGGAGGGACQVLTASQCSTLSGTYGGDGSGCTVSTFNLAGDCNQDGAIDLSDVICLLGHLFQGNPATLPCSTTPGNLLLMDCNQDGGIDLSDAIFKLAFLFQGGPGPVQGPGCLAMPECPQNTAGCGP
jgi:hypothetical protein